MCAWEGTGSTYMVLRNLTSRLSGVASAAAHAGGGLRVRGNWGGLYSRSSLYWEAYVHVTGTGMHTDGDMRLLS